MTSIKPEQKYSVGERVEVHSWTRTVMGVVEDIDWIYHPRAYRHCWGYKVKTDNDEPTGLTFAYIPEGYLRPVEEDHMAAWHRLGKKARRHWLAEDAER